MNVAIAAILAFLSTALGGITAISNRRYLRMIMGWTAGVLLGVVAFDIFPEISKLSNQNGLDIKDSMVALVVGFLAFHILEKSILLHHGHEGEYGSHSHRHVGLASALALSGHSFLDGVGIGLGFQASNVVGVAVAIAVIAHDFSDGLNTVTLMLVNNNNRKSTLRLLVLDAAAPLLGAASTLLFTLSDKFLLLYLGFFAGFLLYIGVADILPQAHSRGSSRLIIFLTVLGAVFMYLVTQLA